MNELSILENKIDFLAGLIFEQMYKDTVSVEEMTMIAEIQKEYTTLDNDNNRVFDR